MHCAVRTWLWCGTSRDALLPSPLAKKLPHGRRIKSTAVASDRCQCRIRCSWRKAHALIAPWRISRPPTEHARVYGLGCGAGQLSTRSSSASWPLLSRTATASGRWLRLRTPGGTVFDSRGARPACSSPRGESVDRPRNTSACTAWYGLGGGAGQLATRSSPAPWPWLGRTATASDRRLRLRTVGVTAFDNPLRAARALITAWRIGRPPTEHARVLCAVRTWLWCGTSRDALLPSPLAKKLPHGHRIKLAAAASNYRQYRIRCSWRAARALTAPWRIGRPPTEYARVHRAVRTWLWCGPTCDALFPSSLTKAQQHGHRIKSAAAASHR